MENTNVSAINALATVSVSELEDMLSVYLASDGNGSVVLGILLTVAKCKLDYYRLDGSMLHKELQDARGILSKTRYGKRIPVDASTLKPVCSSSDIWKAKDTVNEYHRLRRLVKKLKRMGLYSAYC